MRAMAIDATHTVSHNARKFISIPNRQAAATGDACGWQGNGIMTHRRLLTILFFIAVCALWVWAVDWAAHRQALKTISELAPSALCVVELKEGSASASGSFTTSQTIEKFHVRACPEAKRERLSLSFDANNIFQFTGTIAEPQEFGVGRMIPPGTYAVTLRQETGKHGGIVVILDKATPSTDMTGWQVISRAYLGLLVISGIWAFANRKSSNQRRRLSSALAFQYVFLGFFVMFFFLLCHEGGHALAEIGFGRYDFAESDFWGIHGHPHSGGKAGPTLEPWQQGLITGGAVIAPTLAAWALFVFWWLWLRRRRNQIVRLYCSVTVGMLNLQYIVIAGGVLLGIMSNGHFDAFVDCMPGPEWLGIVISWWVLLVCALILWHIVPEIMRILKAQHLEIEKRERSQEPNESNHPQASQPTAPTDG
jgi:hypothetical protein